MCPPTFESADDGSPLSLLLGDFEPAACKLHCAVHNGTDHPADVLARDWDEWVDWNSWRPNRNDFNRDYIFSLAQTHDEPHTWLFGGVFEVMARRPEPRTISYDVELREQFLPGCIRRLKVSFERPRGRNVRLNMDTYVDQITVSEILREPYDGEPFPGHDSINVTLAELEVIYAQERADWRGALQFMEGVYVIYDRASGKSYVGSAIGDTGIWTRWGQYVETRHGGNVDLRALVKRVGDNYARANLAFSLLQAWPMATPDEEVLARESFWKDVLLSRQFGHNRN